MSLLPRFAPKVPFPGILFFLWIPLFACNQVHQGSQRGPKKAPATPPKRILPKRIVSLAPSITESLAFLGLTSKLVAVTRYCDYPPEVKDLPKVGGYIDPSLEAIVRVAPDLILGLGEHHETIDKLRRAGLRCLALDERNLEGIFSSLLRLGQICGVTERARKKVLALRTTITKTQALVRGKGTPMVLVSVGRHAGQGAVGKVYAAGPKTFLGQLIEIAGGKNLAPTTGAAFPPLSTEGLLRLNPEVLFDIVPGMAEQGILGTQILSDWKKLPQLQAVRQGRVYVLGANWAVRPSPRFPKILEAFVHGLHPDLAQPSEKK